MVVEATSTVKTHEPLAMSDAGGGAFFRGVFDREHAYVHRSLLRLGVPARDAEDLTHDAFVIVHRKLASYDRSRPLRPWLCAIAARVASNYRRLARHRLEHMDGAIELLDLGVRADVQLEQRDARALLLQALNAVDDDRRPLLIMVDLDETSVPDAALALEIPLNTAYSRLRIARAELTAAVRRLAARRDGTDRGAA